MEENLEKLFVSYELALELKEKGFDEKCLYYYYGSKELQSMNKDNNPYWTNHNNSIFLTCYSAPLYQQVVDWFREKHNLYLEIHCTNTKFPNDNYEVEISRNNEKEFGHFGYNNYYEALNKAIEKALKLI